MASITSRPIMEHIFPLPRSTSAQPKPSNPVIQAGHRYSIDAQKLADNRLGDLEHDLQNGLLGSYRLSTEQAIATAVDTQKRPIQAFVWNSELLSSQLKDCLPITATHPLLPNHNRLTLLDAGMTAPEVRSCLKTYPILRKSR